MSKRTHACPPHPRSSSSAISDFANCKFTRCERLGPHSCTGCRDMQLCYIGFGLSGLQGVRRVSPSSSGIRQIRPIPAIWPRVQRIADCSGTNVYRLWARCVRVAAKPVGHVSWDSATSIAFHLLLLPKEIQNQSLNILSTYYAPTF